MTFDRKNLTNEQLLYLYTSLLMPRLIEEKMLILIRQGKVSKWFSGIGQEAIAVGVTAVLDADEYIYPCIAIWGYSQDEIFRCTDFFRNGRAKPMDLPRVETAVFILVHKNSKLLE